MTKPTYLIAADRIRCWHRLDAPNTRRSYRPNDSEARSLDAPAFTAEAESQIGEVRSDDFTEALNGNSSKWIHRLDAGRVQRNLQAPRTSPCKNSRSDRSQEREDMTRLPIRNDDEKMR